MKGWVIYKSNSTNLTPELYEAHRLEQEAQDLGIDLTHYTPEQFDLIVTREDEKSLFVDGKVTTLPDFVISRFGANTKYFTLAVLRHLERLGVHCINTATSIEIVKDKLYTHQVLAQNNLPVPRTMLVRFPINLQMVEENLGFPVVIKSLSGSKGSGVFLADSKASFEDVMQLLSHTNRDTNFILQEYIKTSHGKDLRVFTIGGKVIACMKRSSGNGGFKANFSQGGLVETFPLTPEIEWLATETSRLLNLDIAGIDLLFDDGHYKVCEANSSPGFKGIESCCEVNIAKEIFNYARVRLGLF